MDIDYKSIGVRIRYARTQRSLSQEELAEFADVSPVYISNIERGEKSPSLKTVVSVANALNVTVESLLCDSLNFSADKTDDEIFRLLNDCSSEENEIIIKSMTALKDVLREYRIGK